MNTTISRSDLEPVVAAHTGNRTFANALSQISSPEQLLSVLARYIRFNAPFGGGVSNLAGEIAVRPELFRDPDEPIRMLADRSSLIARDVFFAAIDELGRRITHRTLAQATIKGIGEFYGYTPAQMDEALRDNEVMRSFHLRICAGYGLSRNLDEWAVLQALGFHAGSELLADEEFNILNEYLKSKQPDLVSSLEAQKQEAAGENCPAYTWIEVHTSVEADHFDHALAGGIHALEYYAGQHDREWAKTQILEGFRSFGELQAEFMQSLL